MPLSEDQLTRAQVVRAHQQHIDRMARQLIKRMAPQKPDYQDKRHELYAKLATLPGKAPGPWVQHIVDAPWWMPWMLVSYEMPDGTPLGVFEDPELFVLREIRGAQLAHQPHPQTESDTAWLRRERARLMVQGIQLIVDKKLYAASDAESLLQTLTTAFKDLGIDLATASPEEFYTPYAPMLHSGPTARRPTNPPGPQTDHRQNRLLDTIDGCLQHAGWSRRKSRKFLAEVQVYCLGYDNSHTDDAEDTVRKQIDALRSRQKRLRRKTKR